jgi:beta-mannanase
LSQDGRVQAVGTFETVLGRKLDVVHVYHDWADPMPSDSDRALAKQGGVVLLSWGGADTRAIQEGRYDDVIKRQADALRGWDAKVLLEWRWEMDRPNLHSQIWSPQDYVAAWKHIRAIFAAEGATNVGWVWCPLAVGFDNGRAQPYYPGDDQVDWIGADVYPGPQTRPFATVAASFLTWAKDHPKPIIIGEFGIKQSHGDATQKLWLQQVAQFVPTVPQIKALVYFNADNSDADKPYDMSLLNSPDAMAAFKAMAATQYFDVERRK